MKHLLLVFSVITFSVSACKEKCGTGCLNGGVCNEGVCECVGRYGGELCDTLCPIGYEGLTCSDDSRNKFEGSWNALMTDTIGQNIQHNITISKLPGWGLLRISNFGNYNFNCQASIQDPKIFFMNAQTVSGVGVVSGTGFYNNGRLNINLTINNTEYVAQCSR